MESRVIEVKSIEGLDFTLADVWKVKPILCIGDEAYEVVHPKMQDAKTVTFRDEDGKSCQLRLRRVEPIAKPIPRVA